MSYIADIEHHSRCSLPVDGSHTCTSGSAYYHANPAYCYCRPPYGARVLSYPSNSFLPGGGLSMIHLSIRGWLLGIRVVDGRCNQGATPVKGIFWGAGLLCKGCRPLEDEAFLGREGGRSCGGEGEPERGFLVAVERAFDWRGSFERDLWERSESWRSFQRREESFDGHERDFLEGPAGERKAAALRRAVCLGE